MTPENREMQLEKLNRLQPRMSEPSVRAHAGMPIDLSEEELTAEGVNGGVFASNYGGAEGGGVTPSFSFCVIGPSSYCCYCA
ncbi:hypothetical protein [Gloeothece verrucosa]|uniref:Uncharacterized protein n=1 Tax=Gloeothece verrucosa (strain PCC 7822) TaxID=497965 RepID=E0UMX4_GLOV7|nr:hypothetical protein [Gloeothece verrucosa]ADN18304.1 hypothetical protein Cyan7822_6538 [Gloeothece verrucosa PCC 7822]